MVRDRQARAARRAFIRTHHPDRGGDPAVFVAGLEDPGPGNAAPVVVYRARRFTPLRWFRRVRRRHRMTRNLQ